MSRTKRGSIVLEQARHRLAGIKSINPAPSFGPSLTLTGYEADVNAFSDKVDAYNEKLSTLDPPQRPQTPRKTIQESKPAYFSQLGTNRSQKSEIRRLISERSCSGKLKKNHNPMCAMEASEGPPSSSVIAFSERESKKAEVRKGQLIECVDLFGALNCRMALTKWIFHIDLYR